VVVTVVIVELVVVVSVVVVVLVVGGVVVDVVVLLVLVELVVVVVSRVVVVVVGGASTNSYAPMSNSAPLIPSPSSGRGLPSWSWSGASVALPESMQKLGDCRRRSFGGETNCGFCEILPAPGSPLSSQMLQL